MHSGDFSYLWDGSSNDWVLVQLDGSPSRFVIANAATSRALIIEDEATSAAVIQTMLARGSRVITARQFAGRLTPP
jgi:hypothetical protein